RHVRTGHRRAVVGVGATTRHGGLDTHTRGVDVHGGTVVGERGRGVGLVGGGHGGHTGGTGGRDVVGVLALVARGDRDEHTGLGQCVHRLVQRLGGGPTQGQVRDRSGLGVLRHPLDTRDDVVVGAGTVVVQHLDPDQVGARGDTVTVGTDGAGHVGAVPLRVPAERGAATEVGVVHVQAGVQDVGSDTAAVGLGGVGVVQWQILLVDTVQTPWHEGFGHTDLLDVGDAFLGAQLFHLGLAHVDGVAVDDRFVRVVHLIGGDAQRVGLQRCGVDGVLQDDEPLIGDTFGAGVQRCHLVCARGGGTTQSKGDGEGACGENAECDLPIRMLRHAYSPYGGIGGCRQSFGRSPHPLVAAHPQLSSTL